MNRIDSFHGEFRFLSNFWPVIVTLDGMQFPSVEHAYMAAKTLDFGDRTKIQMLPTAGQAKRAGRAIKLRPDWDQVKLVVMENLLRQKFHEPALKKALLWTDDAILIEGNTWGDRFWGVCNGRGENHLGKLLMKIRQELRDK